jgi:hypothetical protein
MVRISLDDINLSKKCPVFVRGTDRTCGALTNSLDIKTLKVPSNDTYFTLRTNTGQDIRKKSVGHDNEIN